MEISTPNSMYRCSECKQLVDDDFETGEILSLESPELTCPDCVDDLLEDEE